MTTVGCPAPKQAIFQMLGQTFDEMTCSPIPGERRPTPEKPVTSCLNAPFAADEKKHFHRDNGMHNGIGGFTSSVLGLNDTDGLITHMWIWSFVSEADPQCIQEPQLKGLNSGT